MKKIIGLVLLTLLFACGQREFELPPDVKEVLELAGKNRTELEKVINHYKKSGNVIGEESAYFLIGNMKNQGYMEYKLVDSTGSKVDFNVLDYKDYDALLNGWDEIESNKGAIHFAKDTFYNDYIKSWFRFDPRYYEHPTDQGLQEMLDVKLGRCEDMTNLAIYAMRALGIPVMSDFTPYWANTGNNHAWNAILDKNDSTIIFMGGEANPGEYSLGHKLAKVYRKTYAIQKNSLPEKMEKWEKAPPYLNSSSIRDVTPEYVPTSRVKIDLTQGVPDSTNFAYLCVFNSGEWKAIDYTRLYGNKANFSKMGLGIAYLPAFYYEKEIIPAGHAFILTNDSKVNDKVPDGNNLIDLTLYSTTKRVTKETTDFIEHAEFTTGKTYTLYYWNNKWVEAGKKVASDGPLVFNNIPSNAIYWLVEDGSRKEERIFTIDEKGNQVWW